MRRRSGCRRRSWRERSWNGSCRFAKRTTVREASSPSCSIGSNVNCCCASEVACCTRISRSTRPLSPCLTASISWTRASTTTRDDIVCERDQAHRADAAAGQPEPQVRARVGARGHRLGAYTTTYSRDRWRRRRAQAAVYVGAAAFATGPINSAERARDLH
eukprot:1836714-Prymnesium_polylepis.1